MEMGIEALTFTPSGSCLSGETKDQIPMIGKVLQEMLAAGYGEFLKREWRSAHVGSKGKGRSFREFGCLPAARRDRSSRSFSCCEIKTRTEHAMAAIRLDHMHEETAHMDQPKFLVVEHLVKRRERARL